MNKLKASKEKINDLMAKADEIISSARMEVRDLTDVELTSLAEYRSEIEEANKSIEGIKEERAVEGKLENGEKNNEVKDLDNKEKQAQLENRSVELYLRGKQNTESFMQNEQELRDITGGMTAGKNSQDTAGNGGITIPDGVYSQIIRKLEQQAPLLGLVEQIPSVTGTLAIARESKASDNMAFVGEGIDAKQLEGQLKTVRLTQKRVAAAFQLTQQLINDSAVNITDYAVERVTRSVSRRITSSILVGSAKDVSPNPAENFSPVIGDAEIKKVELDASGITVENLIDMRSKLHQGYTSGAVWVVSNAAFQTMAKLKDGDGSFLIFRSLVAGDPEYTLFGAKVFVDDSLDDLPNKEQIVYGNFNAGYAVMIKKGMNLVHVTADSQQALAGGHLVVLDTYMDGVVKNPDAFIIGATKKA